MEDTRVTCTLFPDSENKVEHLNLKKSSGDTHTHDLHEPSPETSLPPSSQTKPHMELPPTRDLAIAAGVAFTTIFAYYHARERKTRTRKIQRTDERVLILGASSGVGRTLAHLYAQRGARVCVVGRRQREIEEVELECKTIQRIKESEEDRNAFSFCADFANPEQMVMLRDIIQAGEFLFHLLVYFWWRLCSFVCRMARCRYRDRRCGS